MESLVPTTESRTAALHSTANPAWGTPPILRRFAACVLRPASSSGAIDLDYATSSYWQRWWLPDDQPIAYLDGSPGRDVLIEADRHAAVKAPTCGAGFLNAPGLNGGEMLQKSWIEFEADHRTGWLGSGFWTGFSIEQVSSLQGCGERHPLSINEGVTTIVPSRRVRYVIHPSEMIDLLRKKQGKRSPDHPTWRAEQRQIEKLLVRTDDEPVQGSAPPHSSYLTILWSRDRSIKRRQMDAAKQFIDAQHADSKSLLHTVAIVGEWA